MIVGYNKLWKLLIDKNMKKKGFGKVAGVSNLLVAKLDENVTVEVLVKTCTTFGCGLMVLWN